MKHRLRIGLALGGGLLAGLAWLLLRWDRLVLGWLYLRPVALLEVMRVLDYPGSWMATIPATGLAFAILWRPGWIWLALRPMGTLAGATLIAESLKYYVNRPRPDTTAQTGDFWGQSFPSDHALAGLAFWFCLGQVFGELWPEGRSFFLFLGVLLGALTGWSQVFLGVNWPADVVAGWALALLLLAAMPGPAPPQAGRVKAKK